MITQDDITFAEDVVAAFPGVFFGGSYVVNGVEAGDIDLVVPHAMWPEVRAALSGEIEKVRKEFPTESEVAGDMEDERLITVYRRGAVDLLVIHDEYVESYRRAVADMKADPERFKTRAARVAIHIHHADAYRLEKGGVPLEWEIKAARRARGHNGGSGDYPER